MRMLKIRLTLTTLLAFLPLLPAAATSTAHAQAYRSSILHVEAAAPAETPLPDRAGVKPWLADTPDSAGVDTLVRQALHPPEVQELHLQPPLVQPIVVGALATIAGAYAGAQIGDLIEGNSGSSSEYLPVGAAIGFLVGETIGLPLGVHFGNARRGNFAGDLGISLLGHLGAIGLAGLTGSLVGYAIGVAGQLAITVATERHVGGRKARERAARAEQP